MVRTEFLCISSSFHPNRSSYNKSQIGQVFRDHEYTMVENTFLVFHDGIITEKFSDTSSSKHINFTIQKISKVLTLSENEIISRSLIRKLFRNINFPREITNVIVDSWRITTKSRYESQSILRRWFVYATLRNTDPCTPDVCKVLSFLHGIYINVCLYNGLCAARSALSSIVIIKGYTKLAEHPFISPYLKGKYNRHPPLPKYTSIWNISFVLVYYNSIEINDKLQFTDLVQKTVMLFMILRALGKQGLFTLTVDNIVTEENKMSFSQIKP